STITAISRQETGQSPSVTARGSLSWDAAASPAFCLVLPGRSLAPVIPWLPIVMSSLATCSVQTRLQTEYCQRDWSSGPMASGGTNLELGHFSPTGDKISGS